MDNNNMNVDRMPLVSIGMPIYNVEPYVERSLTSVLEQTYSNIEILAIDDCGTDHSMNIVNYLMSEHQNGNMIKIIHHECNKGLGEARNSVINNAKGKYIYFIDSDDYIEKDTISLMVNEAERFSADVVHTVARTVYYKTGIIEQNFPEQPYRVLRGKDEFAKYVCQDIRRHVSFTSWNILFSTDFLRLNNLHFYSVICEDILFFSDYYPLVKTAVLMPDVTYNYLIREGSIMGNMKRDKIPANGIRKWFEANLIMLDHAKRIKTSVFYDVHCAKLLKQNFRSVCIALRHRHRFDDYLTDQEICKNLHHPSTIKDILAFNRYRIINLFFKLLGMLPSWLCVRISYLIGKMIRWI